MNKSYCTSVAQLFDQIVELHPCRKALIFEADEYVTYAELFDMSNQLAAFLVSQGLYRGQRIGFILDKSKYTYALIIAALKIGAPYFFVDPANPVARVHHIINKCSPSILIYENSCNAIDVAAKAFLLDDLIDLCQAYQSNNDIPSKMTCSDICASDAAYIMFTSGSTGQPKGAVMSHQNLINFIAWSQNQFGFTEDDVFTNVNPIYFDNSVFDVYSSFFIGATLVPFSVKEMTRPQEVVDKITRLNCTVFFSVPSLIIYFQVLRVLTPDIFNSMKKIIFGGEGYPKIKLKDSYELYKHRIDFYNVYGPTECTCICSVYKISDEDFEDMNGYPPLGKLISNFSYYIVEDNNIVEDGQSGELWLSGPNVGLGYYNDQELSDQAFVQDPFNINHFSRVYKTGDIVRYNYNEQKISFVGRKDNQIKHQGYRIELGEIESALNRIDNVDEAIALQIYKNEISMILAVIATVAVLSKETIKQELAKYIPKYMIPNLIYFYDKLPKNANGKIDRKLLKEKYNEIGFI